MTPAIRELARPVIGVPDAEPRAPAVSAIIESQREGVLLVDADGTILQVNAAGARLAGRQCPDELAGTPATALVADAHHDAWHAALAQCINGFEWSVEVQLDAAGRGRFWAAVHLTPFGDAAEAGRAALCLVQDIDAHRAAENAIARYLSTLKTTLEATADGILVIGVDGSITAHNRRFCQLWHIDREALGVHQAELVWAHIDAMLIEPNVRASWPALLERDPKASLRRQLELRDGRTFEVVSHPQILEGTIAGRVWSVRDLSDRIAAERSLRRSEELYRSLIENAADIVLACDTRGRLVYVSHSIERVLGHSPESVVGELALELVHPDDLDTALSAFLHHSTTPDSTSELRLRVRAADGEWRWLHLKGRAVPAEHGGAMMHIIARDITALVKAENDLQRTNDTLTALLSAMPLALVSVDRSGNVVGWNRAAESMFGWRADEVLGRPHPAVPPELRDRHLELVNNALDGNVAAASETVRVTRDGRRIDVAIWNAPVRSAGAGAPDVAIGLIADISDRKRMDLELRRNEQRFRALIDNALDVVVMLRADGSILFGSPSAERLVGYTRHELRGRSVLELVHPDDLQRVSDLLHQTRDACEDARAIEMRVRHRDGTQRYIEGLAKWLPHAVGTEGTEGGIIVNARDVTGRRELEAQLRQAQKMEAVGQLAGGIAHDFNNMLTAIKGFSMLLEEDDDPDADHDLYVAEIRKAADRAASLTQQLLAFSRRQVLQPRTVELNAVVLGMQGMLQRLIGSHVMLRTELCVEPTAVLADPTQLEQVIMNLVVNARDAMTSGGRLLVATRNAIVSDAATFAGGTELNAGPHVVLSIADTGSGMDEATIDRIFDPFFTTKEAGRGTGLGLSTVYGIVAQSGGAISVSSRIGAGTTFEIYLPAAEQPALEDHVDACVQPVAQARGTVLLVDDEPGVRVYARKTLQRHGYNVLEAVDGESAREIFNRNATRIDIVVSDIGMPGIDGHDLLRLIRRTHGETPVLLMSGSDQSAVPEASQAFCAYLAKPFAPDELVAAISGMLTPAAAGA